MSKHTKNKASTQVEELNINEAIKVKDELKRIAAGENITLSKDAAKQAVDLIETLLT